MVCCRLHWIGGGDLLLPPDQRFRRFPICRGRYTTIFMGSLINDYFPISHIHPTKFSSYEFPALSSLVPHSSSPLLPSNNSLASTLPSPSDYGSSTFSGRSSAPSSTLCRNLFSSSAPSMTAGRSVTSSLAPPSSPSPRFSYLLSASLSATPSSTTSTDYSSSPFVCS